MVTGLSSNNEDPRKESKIGSKEDSKENSKGLSDDTQGLKKLGLFAIVMGELVGCTGAGIALGYFAWAKLGAPWWVLLLSTTAGLSLAFYQLYKISEKEL